MAEAEVTLYLDEVARRLDEAGITWAVFAGAAASAYGATRPITDIDILVPAEARDRLAELFPEAEASRGEDGRVEYVQLPHFDIMAGLRIPGEAGYTLELDGEMAARLRWHEILGFMVPVIPPEDNILWKAFAGRGPDVGKHDWQDVQAMIGHLPELDWSYLRRRAEACASPLRREQVLRRLEALRLAPVSSLRRLRAERLPPQTGRALELERGQFLRVIDPLGEQVADLVCFALADRREWLSSGRTFDYSDTIRLTIGHVLYSNRSNPMLTIIQDSVGRHDFLFAPCSPETFRIIYAQQGEHPSCLANLSSALSGHGIGPDDIPTAFNIFMNVEVSPDGALHISPPLSRPGDAILFRAEMDLIVGLTACSAEKTNNYRFKPIDYEVLEA